MMSINPVIAPAPVAHPAFTSARHVIAAQPVETVEVKTVERRSLNEPVESIEPIKPAAVPVPAEAVQLVALPILTVINVDAPPVVSLGPPKVVCDSQHWAGYHHSITAYHRCTIGTAVQRRQR